MSNEIKNGDRPAMPLQSSDQVEHLLGGDAIAIASAGLTKREHFAAMAMQGFCANGRYEDGVNVANDALLVADALLEELEK